MEADFYLKNLFNALVMLPPSCLSAGSIQNQAKYPSSVFQPHWQNLHLHGACTGNQPTAMHELAMTHLQTWRNAWTGMYALDILSRVPVRSSSPVQTPGLPV